MSLDRKRNRDIDIDYKIVKKKKTCDLQDSLPYLVNSQNQIKNIPFECILIIADYLTLKDKWNIYQTNRYHSECILASLKLAGLHCANQLHILNAFQKYPFELKKWDNVYIPPSYGSLYCVMHDNYLVFANGQDRTIIYDMNTTQNKSTIFFI